MIFTRRIDWLMFRNFIGPMVMNFLIILFILVLQFVSMYIQDIMGKGIGPSLFLKLFFYASGHLSLSAMPVAMLAAALMTMGGLGERYELAAIKSSGINVFKASRTLVLMGVLITLLMMWFSFNVVPKSNLKFFSLIYDIKKKKADIALQAGHFYRDIDNYAIRVGDKNKLTGMLFRVRIYHHGEVEGNSDVIQADSARMDLRKDRLAMILYSGTRYEEVKAEGDDVDNYPFSRTNFDSLIYKFDLGDDFELNRTDESQFKHQITLTRNQLGMALDSIDVLEVEQDKKTFKQLARYTKVDSQFARIGIYDSALLAKVPPPLASFSYDGADSLISCFRHDNTPDIISRALTNARAVKSYLEFAQRKKEDQHLAQTRYDYEYQLRLAIPINCLLFLLIGVSLGAIIRKGGLGVPALISITLFILFYVLTTYGRKSAKDGNIDPWFGAWISVLVFTPIAIVLVYQATTDSRILDESQWTMVRDRIWLARAYVGSKIKGLLPTKKSQPIE
ncbi:MAG: LptF/LptG family permease [Bacteroidia bacterium]|nr:LptF/LptG family permease [Bacteroidia bacterium]